MDMFEKIMERQKRFEKTHIRVRNEELFHWFRREGLSIIKSSCDKSTLMQYQVNGDGITVHITTKELLLLPTENDPLVSILRKASICFLDVTADERLKIALWFDGYIWKAKKKSGRD